MASGVTSRTQRPRSGFRGWVVLTCVTATGWLLAASGQACEVPEGPPTLALERCLLVEQGMRANLEGRYDEADATWQALRERDPTDPAPEIWSASASNSPFQPGSWATTLTDIGNVLASIDLLGVFASDHLDC